MGRDVRFIADMHFCHEKSIMFDNRPFKDEEDMTEKMIEMWNKEVGKDDLIYSLGDMFWNNKIEAVRILKELKGQIILIQGNHDHKWLDGKTKSLLAGIKQTDEISIPMKDGTHKNVFLSHYYIPFYNRHYHGEILLHGHSHNSKEREEELKYSKYLNENGFTNEIYNVGAMLPEIWYTPRTLDYIINAYKEV